MKKYSLYTIVFGIFVVLILVSSVSVYISLNEHRKDLINSATDEKTRLASSINETIASPNWIYRLSLYPAGLEEAFITEMAKFQDVRYLRVVRADGSIAQSSIGAEWGQKVEDPALAEVLNSQKVIIRDDIYNGEKVKTIIYPGYENRTIWVAFSLASVEKTIKGILIRDITITVGGLIMMILITFFILRSIINPLKRIIIACEEVKRGNLDVRTDIRSLTEIGELASTFNEMIKGLRDSQTALEESKTSLEIKVQARTKELKELSENLELEIKKRTQELQERLDELEKFQKLTIGRELKMIELKAEIEKLKMRLKK